MIYSKQLNTTVLNNAFFKIFCFNIIAEYCNNFNHIKLIFTYKKYTHETCENKYNAVQRL